MGNNGNGSAEIRILIDGKEVTVPEGTTVLQAAEGAGIFIPRYCYHPGLSIVGSCRICQVEVKGRRDPVISCYERAQEGMEVMTGSTMVKRVRRAVMEFLLLNHPIDCPICDTSGECDLQNYYMTEGLHRSRLEHPKINRKKATRIGAKVVLDQERCILCSRCVRFTSEVTKTHELGLFGRGSTEVIDIIEGRPLENPYAGCVVDLCPVGALTDDDFRFKCRVWYLEETRSICPRCSAGCNIQIHSNTRRPWIAGGKRVMRLKPRPNPEVNRYWICDFGRYGYSYIDGEDRIRAPRIREDGKWREGDWEEILGALRSRIVALQDGGNGKGIVAVPSPWMTNEALFLFDRLLRERCPRALVGAMRGSGPAGGDGFLIRHDRNPNRLGLETILLGDGGRDADPIHILEKASREGCRLLILFDSGPEEGYPVDLAERALGRAEHSIVFGTKGKPYMEGAEITLPLSTHAEMEGTYTNHRGRVQRFWTAFPPVGHSLPDWKAVSELGRVGFGLDWRDDRASDVFDALAAVHPEYRGLDYGILGELGAPLRSCESDGMSA